MKKNEVRIPCDLYVVLAPEGDTPAEVHLEGKLPYGTFRWKLDVAVLQTPSGKLVPMGVTVAPVAESAE